MVVQWFTMRWFLVQMGGGEHMLIRVYISKSLWIKVSILCIKIQI